MRAKNTIYIIVGILILILAAYLAFSASDTETYDNVLSFQDCLQAGYPVMESNPRQCKTPDGRTFAEELPKEGDKITYDNATSDMIELDLPTPGAVVGKEFSVIGRARGSWYFEASFPISVLDKDGKTLAEGSAAAQGEWMTADFVDFKGDLKIPDSYIGPAILVLKKDNPSGLPENDASITLPIIIEY